LEPTPSPTVEPTPVPPTPTPSIILSESGTGDKILRIEAQDLPTVAHITGRGRSNFAVISYVGSDYEDLLVNEIGTYEGFVYVSPYVDSFEITSSGKWQIEISALEAATQWDGTTPLSGEGDSVVLVSGASFGATTIDNRSRSNFAVIAYDEFGDYLDLLVNEIGNYHGEVLLPDDDPIVLSIQDVNGKWSLSAVEF
jgi:hypothetical protein